MFYITLNLDHWQYLRNTLATQRQSIKLIPTLAPGFSCSRVTFPNARVIHDYAQRRQKPYAATKTVPIVTSTNSHPTLYVLKTWNVVFQKWYFHNLALIPRVEYFFRKTGFYLKSSINETIEDTKLKKTISTQNRKNCRTKRIKKVQWTKEGENEKSRFLEKYTFLFEVNELQNLIDFFSHLYESFEILIRTLRYGYAWTSEKIVCFGDVISSSAANLKNKTFGFSEFKLGNGFQTINSAFLIDWKFNRVIRFFYGFN